MNALTADEFARLYILPNGWATDLAVVPVVANGTIEDHFGCSTRQLRKGWAFSEERYIRRVMVNVPAPYADCILIRSICVPSMKSGLYKQLVALNQNSVVVKAHCDCVAGLSETCQHVAALLFVVADIQQPSSTGSRCLWNVPSQNAKRACPAPLKDITFKKHVVHKKKEVKVKRQLLSVSAPSGGCLDDVKHYVDAIKSKEPGLLWCRYVGQPEPPRFQCPILDDDDLHSKKCRQLFRAQMEAIRPLELAEASAICSATVGQGRNPLWKRERVGRITASNFTRVVHCQQPESLVRDILYPQNVKLKPGDLRLYGIENEGKAVQQYLELMTYYDKEVRVEEAGLLVYHEYPCIGASPDRIVYDGEEVGVLEVKCPLSKKGQTPKAAALDKKFYAYILEGEVTLKRDSAHYYQVQVGCRWISVGRLRHLD
ncbi:unnamed protein product [Ixodes hexagonus]